MLDNGAPGHSVFGWVFMQALEKNDKILSGPELFAAVNKQVQQKASESEFVQKPQYKVIKGAGHEVGDFFFIPI